LKLVQSRGKKKEKRGKPLHWGKKKEGKGEKGKCPVSAKALLAAGTRESEFCGFVVGGKKRKGRKDEPESMLFGWGFPSVERARGGGEKKT